MPTPWDEKGPALRTLARHELAGGRGRGMNGTHRPEGIWIASAAARSWLGDTPVLADVAPALLRAIGGNPVAERSSAPAESPYTPEEEARVAARLRALGYLE